MSVAVRLRRPTVDNLRRRLEDAHGATVTYEPIGLTGMEVVPAGYRRDRWTRRLGSDDATFAAAVEAIRTWEVHRGAGFTVCVDGPPAEGRVIAMSAPLPIGYIDAVCRVVAVIDQPDRYGFAYGTLPTHPERGEESFLVVRDAGGAVRFEITAISRPKLPLSPLWSPLARLLQHRASMRYLAAMTSAAST